MEEYHLWEVYDELEKRNEEYESDSEFARQIGISRSHMSRLLRREAKPGAKVLKFLGLESLVVYVDDIA